MSFYIMSVVPGTHEGLTLHDSSQVSVWRAWLAEHAGCRLGSGSAVQLGMETVTSALLLLLSCEYHHWVVIMYHHRWLLRPLAIMLWPQGSSNRSVNLSQGGHHLVYFWLNYSSSLLPFWGLILIKTLNVVSTFEQYRFFISPQTQDRQWWWPHVW